MCCIARKTVRPTEPEQEIYLSSVAEIWSWCPLALSNTPGWDEVMKTMEAWWDLLGDGCDWFADDWFCQQGTGLVLYDRVNLCYGHVSLWTSKGHQTNSNLKKWNNLSVLFMCSWVLTVDVRILINNVILCLKCTHSADIVITFPLWEMLLKQTNKSVPINLIKKTPKQYSHTLSRFLSVFFPNCIDLYLDDSGPSIYAHH